ncbi:MAG: GFA family protein [Gammaproteobacteria bacterium]|nr:GFA family protein [Gammaproteobacteria bacterium]
MTDEPRTRTGGCLCGGVRYRVVGEIRPVINCFCSQCRKTSGHHFAATQAGLEQFQLLSEESLAWYSSSDAARRGFCNRCGSSLFWQRRGTRTISITAGTLDGPTGLSTMKNIFVEDRSDYHDLPALK